MQSQFLSARCGVTGRAGSSANASFHSAESLIETVVRSTDPSTESAAREFVRNQCLQELTPRLLADLAKIFNPPLGLSPSDSKPPKPPRAGIPRVFLAQLVHEPRDKDIKPIRDEGLTEAKSFPKHPRSFRVEDFRHEGRCPYSVGNMIDTLTTDHGLRSVRRPID